MPGSVVEETMLAGPALRAFRMVIGVLVERDEPKRVQVAEDIPASSTMMPSCEVSEMSRARDLIADISFGIGL